MPSNERTYFPALRGRMGDWAYYSVLMTLEELADRVTYAHQIRENNMLSDLIQRELKTGRAKEIADYLLQNDERFFSSIVVAVYKGDPVWHEFDISPARKDVNIDQLSTTALYSTGYLSLTSNKDETLFALDGQHRLGGIKLALRENPSLSEEEISVIFVAHHETEHGRRRTRNLFTTLNKTAKPVKKNEIIALDEMDVIAICTRHVVETHKYFNAGQVDTLKKQANLHANNRDKFTTIINIYDTLEVAIPSVMERMKREERQALRYFRPAEERVDELRAKAEKFYEELVDRFAPLREYFMANGEERRREVLKKYRSRREAHILFRPIGIKIVAEILRELRERKSLEEAFDTVAKIPVNMNEEPYRDTIWDTNNGTINNKAYATIRDVLLYMLGAYPRNRRGQLRERYAKMLEAEKAELPNRIQE